MTHSIGALLLASVVAVLFVADPASSANYADCKAQAIGMSGDARQQFMNSCLAGTAKRRPRTAAVENRAATPASRKTSSIAK
jgi:hypothetical protein